MLNFGFDAVGGDGKLLEDFDFRKILTSLLLCDIVEVRLNEIEVIGVVHISDLEPTFTTKDDPFTLTNDLANPGKLHDPIERG